MVSTVDKFKYEWIGAPRNKNGIILEVKTGVFSRKGPVRVALAENRSHKDKMYQISIGDNENSITWIGRGKHGKKNFAVEISQILYNRFTTRLWNKTSHSANTQHPL